MKIIVTGGAGFIGSAVCREIINHTPHSAINIDKLTYAANLDSLKSIDNSERYTFYKTDICDRQKLDDIFRHEQPDAVLHLAAESHVDRSITGPADFINSNIVGSFVLLEAARTHWEGLKGSAHDSFRFLHVSTDEVFGSLGDEGLFTEDTPYDPSSPYSASKAASDHLVRAWHRTYDFPALMSNCSNNYGLYQFPEKLIPLVITNALYGRKLPIYGAGDNIRDWLHVEDHARALLRILAKGVPGESYNVGTRSECSNIHVVHTICDQLDRLRPQPGGGSYRDLIEHVSDRPGHDFRYAIDPAKLETTLGWKARETFQSGIEHTIQWYLDNEDWWRPLRSNIYDGERLGLLKK